MILVERYAAPVHTANVAGRQDRAARIGRGEDPFVAQRPDELAALAAVPHGESPGIIGEHRTLWRERRERGERLRGPGLLARDTARGHAPLRDGKQRLTVRALEYVQHAGLRCLYDGGYRHSPDLHVTEHGLRGQVVVPQVVMDQLLLPHEVPAARIERQQ